MRQGLRKRNAEEFSERPMKRQKTEDFEVDDALLKEAKHIRSLGTEEDNMVSGHFIVCVILLTSCSLFASAGVV